MGAEWYLDSRLVALRRELVEAVNRWDSLIPEPGTARALSEEQRTVLERCLRADEAYYEAWKSLLWQRRQTRPRL
jgi:hypothetical protein